MAKTVTRSGRIPRRAREECCSPGSTTSALDADVQETADQLKALAHPVRLGIIHILSAATGPVCACEIEARFTLSQPTISHHLRVLREAGLIDGDQRGSWVHYRMREDAVRSLGKHLSRLGK